MAQSKGTIYLSARLYAEKTLGDDAIRRCLGELDAQDRALLESIVAVGWYPLEPVMAFHRAIDRLYGRGDLAMCREIGRFSADWQLNSFHKLVLRWKSPRWMVEKAGTMWRHYHDTGRWEIVEQPDRNVVTGRLYEFHFVDAAFCMREQGWFERAVELTGGRQPVVRELRCRARGDDACEYSGTWS